MGKKKEGSKCPPTKDENPCHKDPCKKKPDPCSDPCKPKKADPCKPSKKPPDPCKSSKEASKMTSAEPKKPPKKPAPIVDDFHERIRKLRESLAPPVPKRPSILDNLWAKCKKADFASTIKHLKTLMQKGVPLPGKMAEKAGASSGRPMKFPYTFSAKFAQFPIKHYVSNQWIWKYYCASLVVCLPIFYSINKLANSPGNVAKWAEIRRKEAAEHHH